MGWGVAALSAGWARNQAIQISLADALPYNTLCLDIARPLRLIAELGAEWPTDICGATAEARDELHPFTRAALDTLSQTKAEEGETEDRTPLHYHVYTDGSASDGRASWSFCVLEEHAGKRYHLRGTAQGMVETAPDSPLFIGATAADNYTAELSAQVWASAWLLQHGPSRGHAHVPATIWYDCESAAQAIQALTQAQSQPQLVTVATAVAATTGARRQTSWGHVKGHSGHPWNEMADACAEMAMRGKCPMFPGSAALSGLARETPHSLQWAAAAAAGQLDGEDMPPRVDDTFVISKANPPAKPAFVSAGVGLAKARKKKEASVALDILQFNAETLQTTTGRIQHLDRLLAEAGVNIACFQEARTKGPATRQQPHFWAVSGGMADKSGEANLGCEVWVRRSFLAGDREITPTAAQITVAAHSPRMLMVALRHPALAIDIVSAHCPHAGRPKEEAEDFWRQLRAATARRTDTCVPLVLGIDLNGRLGSETSAHVGDHAADNECQRGEALHQYAKDLDLFVPSTFEGHHRGHAHATLEKHGRR